MESGKAQRLILDSDTEGNELRMFRMGGWNRDITLKNGQYASRASSAVHENERWKRKGKNGKKDNQMMISRSSAK